jgi:tripartite-type tricarboxylate transporter receptor subunit TctC
MPRSQFRVAIAVLATAFTACMAASAFAQPAPADTFPSRPVRIIVPFTTGGPTDFLARIIGQKLSELWNQPVLVDNKPGAGANIGTDAVAKATADGYTIGIVSNAYTINPSLYSKLPFDTLRDLCGVTQIVSSAMVLVAHPSVPANSVDELIALAKSKPGPLTYGSVGTGSGTHLAGELFKSATGMDLVHVPYKGTSQVQVDLLAGRVSLMFGHLSSVLQHLRTGKLKALAVLDGKRNPALPDVPAMAETVPGVEASGMFGIVTAAGTPRERVRKLNADIVKVLNMPELKEKIGSMGGETLVGNSAEQFDTYLRSDIRKWAKAVKDSGATAE